MTLDTGSSAIIRRPGRGPRPLSFPQERMFLLEQLMPGQSAYNVPTLYRVDATLAEEPLRQAFELIVARHEILRTALRLQDGAPVQEVLAPRPFDLTVYDLRGREEAQREDEAQRRLGELVRAPFDLSADVLLRAGLVHLGEAEDLLLVVFHHLGSDHASGALLFDELSEAYTAIVDGREPQLPPLRIQYGDFAEWQREHFDGERLDELLSYWTQQLAGAPGRLELPTDRPRPSAQSYRGSWRETEISAAVAAPLRELARRAGVSLFMVLLAGFQTLLHRYSAADDIVVGTPVSGRHQEEIAPLLGFFSNTLALRTDLSGDPPFLELLRRVRATVLGGLAYQELPFEKLVEVLNPERARSQSPIFQVLFGYDIVATRRRTVAGAPAVQQPIPGWASARFDLSMIVHDLPDGSLHAHIGYSTDLFEGATIDRLVGHLRTLLADAARDPARPLSRLELLTGAERHELLVERNATAAAYEPRCLHELVRDAAERRPDAVAVVDEHGVLRYGELERRANRLALELIADGVRRGDMVGICLERSAQLVVALLAVLKAGAAYVPIDPGYPPERQALMLADAHVALVVGEERTLSATGAARVLCLDRDRDLIASQPAHAPDLAGDPDQLAYTIYTSGSTGRPKGVQVTHRSVVNLLAAMRREPGLSESDVVANLTTPAFDLSVPDWYLPLTTGAKLVIVPREATTDAVALGDWLARMGVTFMQATPTTWQLLVDAGWAGAGALKIVCGGEALPRALANALIERGQSLWHMYGPTETTVWSSIRRLTAGTGPPPLGGPIANTTFYVLDAHRQPAPVGVPGELYIGGDGVAIGYHERPQLTAEKFVFSPFGTAERLYRTGDLVRWRQDGTLEFHGRIDGQIKLRGYRIELGEIEAALLAHPTVSAAVAAVRALGPGDDRLVAYVVGRGGRPPAVEELRRGLRAQLPPFMVPSLFVVLDGLPVNANGKLDRRALPLPTGAAAPAPQRAYAAPETPVQQTLCEIWAEVLGVDRIGVDDDFFALGGHSMLAVRMLARVRDAFGAAPYLGAIFDHSTVRLLAEALMLELLAETDEDELASLLAE